jgi:hypothetical protein
MASTHTHTHTEPRRGQFTEPRAGSTPPGLGGASLAPRLREHRRQRLCQRGHQQLRQHESRRHSLHQKNTKQTHQRLPLADDGRSACSGPRDRVFLQNRTKTYKSRQQGWPLADDVNRACSGPRDPGFSSQSPLPQPHPKTAAMAVVGRWQKRLFRASGP